MVVSVQMSCPVFSQEIGQGAGEDIGDEQRTIIQDRQQQIESVVQDKLKKRLPGRDISSGASGSKPIATSSPTETDIQEVPVREPQELDAPAGA